MATIHISPCDDGVVQSAPEARPCDPDLGRWVLAATILGSSLAFIDGTVVNVALPVIQRDFGATVSDAQWVVEAYTLFLAALLLLGGSLGDHFGRRRVFTIGVTLFTLASIGCGLAGDTTQLIVARAVQGVGGALLVPGSLAIISASFSRDQRGRAIGTWSGFTAMTMALGPVLGGWLVDELSWRWIFFINVPIAIAVLTIAYWHVPESRDEDARDLDPWGAILATAGLGGVIYGLIAANDLPFVHPAVVGPLMIGVLALGGFIGNEYRVREPMMPLAVFRSRTFSGVNVMTLLLYAGLSGAMFFLPFNLIQVQGYSATAAGAAFLPFIGIMFTLSRWSGGLVDRFGAKRPLVIGPILAAVGFGLFALPGVGGSFWSTFFPAMAVLGLGMAISVAPLTTTVMNAVSERRAGLASGVNNAISRTAGLLAIAALGIVVLQAFSAELSARLGDLELDPSTQLAIESRRVELAALEVPSAVEGETRAAVGRAIDAAFVAGFRVAMLVAAALALLSAFFAAWLIKPISAGTATDPKGAS